MVRALIVLRCGKNSLHWDWLSSFERNWDIVLCPYEQIDPRGLEATVIPGLKWDGLHLFFKTFTRWKDYDYICLPDDDLAIDPEVLTAFFTFCADKKVDLAAPALQSGSYFSWLTTMQNTNFSARKTAFVEIMMPCFSTAFFSEVMKTFELARSGTGFGLDFLWPEMLAYEGIWISDATPILHTRPVGAMRNQRLSELAQADLKFILGFGIKPQPKTIGGFDRNNIFITATDPHFTQLYQTGYSYIPVNPHSSTETILKFQPRVSAGVQQRLDFALDKIAQKDLSIAYGKPSRVSSISNWSWSSDPDLEASGGNDGRYNGSFGFHTAFEHQPWWQVDLENSALISELAIYNRLDEAQRLVDFDVLVSDNGNDWRVVLQYREGHIFGGVDGRAFRHKFEPKARARFVRVQACGTTSLHLDQIELFGELDDWVPANRSAIGGFPDVLENP